MNISTPALEIIPIDHPLTATVRVSGSKSLTNRALLIAALANGTTRITNALFSDDSRYFAKALQTLGFEVQLDEANSEMTVMGLGGQIPAGKAELFIGNAGTAARFLSAFLTLGTGEYVLDGGPRMRERPIGDLADALTQLGCEIGPVSRTDDRPWKSDHRPSSGINGQICPPIKITGSGLPGGRASVAGNISSQFLSALLMVAPYAQNPVELVLSTELNSKPYVDMTLAVMRDFGVEIERPEDDKFIVHSARYKPKPIHAIESDASAASYFFAAPAICGGTVRVENISRNSVQGDIAFLDVLKQMGCEIKEGDNSIEVTGFGLGDSRLQGIDVDMRDIPDTAQTLAVVAPFASSTTRIRGIASARLKETDRVHASCAELGRLGVRVEEHEDGMTVHPCGYLRPGTVQTYNDHRMAMAFSLVGLRVPGVIIENPACVSKTFPGYFEELDGLR
jgi:3-phosphoshikimate 1-carboxyvinyltransferase